MFRLPGWWGSGMLRLPNLSFPTHCGGNSRRGESETISIYFRFSPSPRVGEGVGG
jgi:hypothetical protein